MNVELILQILFCLAVLGVVGLFLPQKGSTFPLITWTIPGTTRPERCDIFELMKREANGQPVNSSEVVISYHFLDESLAREISERVLTAQEAMIFNQIRAIPPTQFQTSRTWWQFWIKRENVTWLHYAEAIGHDTNSFWEIWAGVGGRIRRYLTSRVPQTSS